MLSAGNIIFFDGLVNARRKVDLYTRFALFDPVGGPIIQRNPVRKYIMRIQSLNQEKRLLGS